MRGWLQAGTPVTEVLANLGAANFDPEFFRQHEAAIVGAFNAQFPGPCRAIAPPQGPVSRIAAAGRRFPPLISPTMDFNKLYHPSALNSFQYIAIVGAS